ncbi:MAG: hypothetical protein P8M30_21160 [Planctomycetaceae bacterium]|nr:hypothetical protein [Planctomycetaceae bacterium]MDG2391822.1 hypothetical protein [Planctomycetaceae bacterium]
MNTYTYRPTSQAVIDGIESLGGTYKLNELGQVHWLNLKCLPISDDDLQLLREMPHIETLNLRGINRHKGYDFTDAGLKHVATLTKLRYLNLTVNFQITDQGIGYLIDCPKLEKLVMYYTRTGVDSLETLSQMPQLEHLWANDISLDEKTLPYFQKMTLKSLQHIKISNDNISLLAELPSLTQAPYERYRKIRDTDLVNISHIHLSEELEVVLTKGWADTSQLKHLANFSHLKKISLSDYQYPKRYQPNNGPFDPSGFETLAALPNLKELSVPPEDRFLAARAMCPHIERISLAANENLTREGLEVITTMPSLKEIWMHESLVNDETLEVLSRVKTLEKLTMRRDHSYRKGLKGYEVAKRPECLTIQGLAHLIKLPNLKVLSLYNWGIDNQMLGLCGQMTSLESLLLGGTFVTNQGIMQLRHLWNLKQLGMYGSKEISQDVCSQLHQYMPACTIYDMWCCGCMDISPQR